MRKNRTKFWVGLAIALVVLASSVVGGYFAIDKLLVPKYFSAYGINNLKELVSIVQTIYIVPDEKEFITNSYSKFDKQTSTDKLITAGFPTLETGSIDYESIATHNFIFEPKDDFVDNFILLTDKEVASIADEIINSGILVSKFPDLEAIDTLNIALKQVIVTPDRETSKDNPLYKDETINKNSAEKSIISTTKNANLKITLKLDTQDARKQISTNLNMPLFLVDWIIPNTIYVTSTIDAVFNEETGIHEYKNATLSINSKTPKQSEVLLNLLISFIFPEDTFTIESFANELGRLAIDGINVLGKMEFATIENSSSNKPLNGIKLYI